MTYTEACEILIKHNEFFELYAVQKYVPRAMEETVNEIKSAYLAINPTYKDKCSNCGGEMIIDCNRHRLKYIKYLEQKKTKETETKTKFYKF